MSFPGYLEELRVLISYHLESLKHRVRNTRAVPCYISNHAMTTDTQPCRVRALERYAEHLMGVLCMYYVAKWRI